MTQDMNVYSKFTDMFKYLIKGTYVHELTNICSPTHEASFVASRTYVLQKLLFLVVLMVLGITSAWAQTVPEGCYYIANNNKDGYDNSDPTKNYYLVPATNYYDAVGQQPFLTTYKTNQDANSIWKFEYVGAENNVEYYHIIHNSTGRYLTFNEKIVSSNADRVRIHLQISLDSENPDNNLFFFRDAGSGKYNICPKAWSDRAKGASLNPAKGNKDEYSGKNEGNPGSFKDKNNNTVYCGGLIGIYDYEDQDLCSYWRLEPTMAPPTFTYDEETGNVTISSVTGTTIHYELDGTIPASGSTLYTAPISMSGHTIIKAIAVRTLDNKVSNVATLTLKEYTYHILNKNYAEAIRKTVTQPVGKPLTDYIDIPTAIRSPYLEGEEVKFFNNSDHAAAHEISETPSTGTGNIYVTYTTDLLMNKYLHLRGVCELNITVNGDYIYDSGSVGAGTLSHKTSPSDSEIKSAPYYWLFSGEDPYAIVIKNVKTNNYLGYTTPISSPTSLSLVEESQAKKFIIMATSGGGEYQQMELMAATGDNNYYRVELDENLQLSNTTATGAASLQVRVYPNSETVYYELIDQAGKILTEITSRSESVDLLSDWKSPLVSEYNYWKAGAFDTYDGGTTYKLKENPEPYRINTLSDTESDKKIYVTYVVNDKVTFDISDDDKAHSQSYPT